MRWLADNARGRIVAALGLIVIVFLAAATQLDLDSAFLLAWDVGILYWLSSTFVYMTKTSAQYAAYDAQQAEPSTRWMLIVVTVTAAFGFLGSVVLASRSADRAEVAQAFHLLIGILAVAEAWLMVHTQFALYYAQVYYDETTEDAARPGKNLQAEVGSLLPFRKGLAFPDEEMVDLWDFVYFSYTIAMCYQTSDVTVTRPGLRRITIVHALISFAFVVVLLGFSVNAISNLL